MNIKKFEDILSWQKAKELTLYVYRSFNDTKDYSFISQIQRASISIMNNIAEGAARETKKQFRNYLSIAQGSSSDIDTQLIISHKLGYIGDEDLNKMIKQLDNISKMIVGLRKSLKIKINNL